MSAAKHTPGPWFARPPIVGRVSPFVTTSNKRRVLFAVRLRNRTRAELSRAMADATLAAAAPELLEALQASHHMLHALPSGKGYCKCSQCAFVRLRDAAIARATDQQGGAA